MSVTSSVLQLHTGQWYLPIAAYQSFTNSCCHHSTKFN